MPRMARKKGSSGIYHVMLRGINKQIIFEDDEDCKTFLQVIKDSKKISGYKLLAYCLMDNHTHMLIKEEKEELEQIFKRIGSRYVYWYNNKYQRTGHLFQDRYKSEPVDSNTYFLTVLRYIHQNPVKAGICKDAATYKWSSYSDYLREKSITDVEYGLSLFSEDRNEATLLFDKFMNEDENTRCLDFDDIHRISDREALETMQKLCGVKNGVDLQNMTPDKRNENLILLKKYGLSIRQIVRPTGISFGIVRKG
jgi:REP element-mobilizing transposase RayT